MTRTASLIAKIAFVLYSIVAIGAVSLALVFPPGIDMDAVVSGIYGGFIFLNLYLLYWLATERARERPEHAADVDVRDGGDIGTLQ
jgi:membrane associated rhomboid family serine protease